MHGSSSGKQNVTKISRVEQDSTKQVIEDVKAVATHATNYTSLDHFPLAIMSALEIQITNQINVVLLYFTLFHLGFLHYLSRVVQRQVYKP